MAERVLSIAGWHEELLYDDTEHAPIRLEDEPDGHVLISSGGLGQFQPVSIVSSGEIISPFGSWGDNEVARWHGSGPAAELQGSDVTISDAGSITIPGIINAGSSVIDITTAAGYLRVNALNPGAGTIDQIIRHDGVEWVVVDLEVDISDDTNLAATSPIVLTDDTLSHASSGVGAGTYRSVTVDVRGHVTAGSNPTIDISSDTNLAATTPIVLTGDTLSHANSGVSAGTYTSVTVNATGHVTAGTTPGGGGVGGSGTANTISKWTASDTLGNSSLTDDGSIVAATLGDFRVGANLATAGLVIAFGNLTTQGGRVRIYNAGDEDTTITYHELQANGSNLLIGTNLDSDIFNIGPDGVTLTAGAINPTMDVWVGRQSGGSSNGNFLFDYSDTFPAFRWRTGTTNLISFVANAASTSHVVDIEQSGHDLQFRNSSDQNAVRIYDSNSSGTVINEDGLDRDFRIEGDTNTHLLFIDASVDRVGINTSTPAGKLHVNQSSTTAAIPVMHMVQADVDQDFFEFETTVGAGNAIEEVGDPFIITYAVKVTVTGEGTLYIPLGTFV